MKTLLAIGATLLVTLLVAAPGVGIARQSSEVYHPAKVAAAKSDVMTLMSAVNNFRLDCDRYPTTKEGLDALVRQPANCHGWKGPYLSRRAPLDPWKHPYHYACPKKKGVQTPVVMSYGADGKPGGKGDNADIVWD